MVAANHVSAVWRGLPVARPHANSILDSGGTRYDARNHAARVTADRGVGAINGFTKHCDTLNCQADGTYLVKSVAFYRFIACSN